MGIKMLCEKLTKKGKPMFFGVKNGRDDERGYTLIDLAMALTIFGLLLAGVATGAKVYMKDKHIAQTREYTRVVAKAIENYVLENGRFPCPGKVNASMDSADYGKETDCSGEYVVATKTVPIPMAAGSFDATLGLWAEESDEKIVDASNNEHTQYVVRGMVPFATLNLPEFYAYDAYGNRLMYAVTAAQTNSQGYINSGGGGITVMDSSRDGGVQGDSRRKTHYVVFSSGPGEEGAWSRYGVEVKPCVSSSLDGENCNTQSDKMARYVSARYSLASNDDRFDDIMVARASKHMPMWMSVGETGRSIRTVEDNKRFIIKTEGASSTLADPIMPAGKLSLDVAGETLSQGALAPKYCMYGDSTKCFDVKELLKAVGDAEDTKKSTFDCPKDYFLQGTADGGSKCTNLFFTCPGHTTKTPKYVTSINDKGEPVCSSYHVSIADPAALEVGECGDAHGDTFTTAPETDLCSVGNESAVTTGDTQYTWTCSASSDPTQCMAYRHTDTVNAECGDANGQNYSSAPTNNLCKPNKGTAGPVTGTGPWVWVCSSQNGGSNAQCSASWQRNGKCGPSHGVPAASPPTSGLCAIGNAGPVSGPNPYKWECAGLGGGVKADCESGPKTSVNGLCGASNNQSFYNQPTTNLCTTGTQSAVTGSGPWNWNCTGTGIPAGDPETCMARKRIDGVCGAANGVPVYSAPSSNLCSVGAASSVAGSSPFTWSCAGSNDGLTVACSAPRRIDGVCGSAHGGTFGSAPASNLCSAGAATTVATNSNT